MSPPVRYSRDEERKSSSSVNDDTNVQTSCGGGSFSGLMSSISCLLLLAIIAYFAYKKMKKNVNGNNTIPLTANAPLNNSS